jgi:hypothetical protein
MRFVWVRKFSAQKSNDGKLSSRYLPFPIDLFNNIGRRGAKMKYRETRDALRPAEFNYGHIARTSTQFVRTFADEQEVLVKHCRWCGAEFTTTSRVKKRCDACQVDATARSRRKARKHQREKRSASRNGGPAKTAESD